jgi:CheY-like chemotaxis protein
METLKSFSDVHILIAEDNIVNQLLMRKIIEKIGMKVVVVSSGIKVLSHLKEEPNKFDLILMDLQMPHMNGLDATKEIVKIYGNNRPKIFAISAGSFNDDDNLYREAGMDDSLDKPFKSEQLIQMINKHKILVV